MRTELTNVTSVPAVTLIAFATLNYIVFQGHQYSCLLRFSRCSGNCFVVPKSRFPAAILPYIALKFHGI